MNLPVDVRDKKVSWASRLRRIVTIKPRKVDQLESFKSGNEVEEESSWNRNVVENFHQQYKLWSKVDVRQDLYCLDARYQRFFDDVISGKSAALEESLLVVNDIGDGVNICDSKGRTALHLVAAFGHENMAQFLLQHGAKIDSISEHQLTPLICAAATGNLEVMEFLISHGADVNFSGNKTPLHWAAASGNLECVKKLVDSGAIQTMSSEVGTTPLLVAAAYGKVDIAKFLVEKGADVRVTQGYTLDSALHLAAASGSESCVRLFLEKLSPHIRNTYGETPLHLAESRQTTSLLLEKGSNSDAVDINGMSPLHFAVMKGDPDFVRLKTLVKQGADVNLQDKNGQTPLHLAALQGASRKAGYLLRNGAKACIKDNNGMSAYTTMKRKMPHAVPQIEASLDSAVYVTQNDPSEYDCILALDFSAAGMIPPPVSDFRHSKILGSPTNLSRAKTKVKLEKETEFIHDLVIRRDKEILAHPLIEAFLALKWKKVNYIFYLTFFFHFLMAAFYTYFTTEAYLASCPDPGNKCLRDSTLVPMGREPQKPQRQWSWLDTRSRPSDYREGRSREDIFNTFHIVHPVDNLLECDIKIAAVVVWGMLAYCTILVILKEVLEIVQRPKQYFMNWENLGQWAIVVSIIITSYWDGWAPCKCTKMCPWHYSSAAVGLLISWSMLLVRIGKFPGLGIYVQMLGKVLQNFGRFILVFLTMMNAFALSFCVLFSTEPAFSSYIQSMLKVFTMMTGELDYQDLFYGDEAEKFLDAPPPLIPVHPLDTQSSFKTSNDSEIPPTRIDLGLGKDLRYPLVAHALYCVFTAVMTISLMNLLVALAVSDIQSLERRARVDRLSRQTHSIYKVENLLFSKFVRSVAHKRILNYIKLKFLLQPDTKRCKFFIRPNDPRDDSLSEELKAKLMQIVLKCKEEKDSDVASSSTSAKCLTDATPPSLRTECDDLCESDQQGRFEKLEEQLNMLRNQLDTVSLLLLQKIEILAGNSASVISKPE